MRVPSRTNYELRHLGMSLRTRERVAAAVVILCFCLFFATGGAITALILKDTVCG
jgi:hypothetical protein